MYSGTYEAVVYDVLLEESGSGRQYERYFAGVGRYESVGLVIGSVAGGLLLGAFSIRVPFAVSVTPLLLAIMFVLRFREPLIHKTHDHSKIVQHIRETVRAVVASRKMVLYLLISMLLGATLRTFWEYTQLWYIQLHLPHALFGVAGALVLATTWVRGTLSMKITMDREKLLVISLVGGFVAALLLTVSNVWIAVFAAIAAMTCNLLAALALNTLQQDQLTSRLRASATSFFGSIGNVAFIPVSMVFGYWAGVAGVTRAVWLPLALLAVSILLAWTARRIPPRIVE